MSAFARAIGPDTRPPARVEVLAADEFSDTWKNRPRSDVAVGIRVPAEKFYRRADYEAGKEETAEAYNRRVMDLVVAAGICDPNNVTAEHVVFPLAEDLVPVALKPRTIKRLFDAIERLAVEQSQVFAEAADTEIDDLWAFLSRSDRFAGMNEIDEARCRRYLRFALEHFQLAAPADEPEETAEHE